MKQQLIRCIENYSPYCEQEQKEKEVILNYLNEYDNLLTRENEYAHFTASSLIVNKDRTKTLLIYHNIYDSHYPILPRVISVQASIGHSYR